MRVTTLTLLLLFSLGLITSSCDLANQASQLANLARCKYRLATLTGLSLAGVNLAGKSISNPPSLAESATLGLAYFSGNFPLSMNVNVEVKNDQKDTAALTQMDYEMSLEGTSLASGSFPKKFTVAPGTIGTLAIPISVNLLTLTGKTQSDLINLSLNLAGQSGNPSTVGLRIRPYFLVGGQTLQFPRYFTVSTTFGGDSL